MHSSLRLLVASLWLVLLPAVALGQSRSEEEATRQLEFAQKEIAAANYQKALTSSESALRLHPPLYEAMAYKALALEGLGDFKTAESLLITYREIRGGWDRFPEGDEILSRVQGKLGDRLARLEKIASLPPFDDVNELADMPGFPDGSEEFLQWLVLRQQVDDARTRMQVGGGLLGGGIGLLVAGGALVGITSALSVDDPNNPNIEAFYSAGLGALFSGGALTAVGLPVTVGGASRLARLKKGGVAPETTARVLPGPTGLAVRF